MRLAKGRSLLWLLVGFALLPLTMWQGTVALAAWLAPMFLLRFTRTSRRALLALPAIFIAYSLANVISGHGLPFNLLGLIGNVLFKALLWTLPYAFDRWLTPRLRDWPRVLVFPTTFVAVDWTLSLLRVSTSLSPAYSQDGQLALLQLVSVTGMWGVTFLIAAFASAANALWEHHFQWRPVRGILVGYVAILAGAVVFGSIRVILPAPRTASVPVATVVNDPAVLSAATAQLPWATFNRATNEQRQALRPRLQATVDTMLVRTQTALKGGAKLVVWQEAGAFILEEDRPALLGRAGALAQQYGAYVQINTGVLTHAPDLKYLLNQSDLIAPNGQVLWSYEKTHPVPFDEAFVTVPGPGTLPIADTPYGRLSTVTCYDAYFPSLVRQAARDHVDILLVPANDSRPIAPSAAAITHLRAIEDGVNLVRATGNGISLVSDARGAILAQQASFTSPTGILITELPTRRIATLYGRLGDVFAYLCLAALAATIAAATIHPRHATTGAERQGNA